MPERQASKEPAHDVLAAEEFPMPAPDPVLHEEPAHDVLAAEEFAMPAPDPAIHHGPVQLPEDLTGTAEARDVLAAEEFAMPAGHAHPPEELMGSGRMSARGGGGLFPLLALGGLVVAVRRIMGRLRRR